MPKQKEGGADLVFWYFRTGRLEQPAYRRIMKTQMICYFPLTITSSFHRLHNRYVPHALLALRIFEHLRERRPTNIPPALWNLLHLLPRPEL